MILITSTGQTSSQKEKKKHWDSDNVNEGLLNNIYKTLSDPRYKDFFGEAPDYDAWKSKFLTSETVQANVFQVLKELKNKPDAEFLEWREKLGLKGFDAAQKEKFSEKLRGIGNINKTIDVLNDEYSDTGIKFVRSGKKKTDIKRGPYIEVIMPGEKTGKKFKISGPYGKVFISKLYENIKGHIESERHSSGKLANRDEVSKKINSIVSASALFFHQSNFNVLSGLSTIYETNLSSFSVNDRFPVVFPKPSNKLEVSSANIVSSYASVEAPCSLIFNISGGNP